MILKISGICILGSVMCILLKQSGKGELALLTALSASIYILFISFSTLSEIVSNLKRMVENSGLDSGVFKTIMKITGIAYITQTASELCRDAGESALSGKVELGGKLLICAYGIPMVSALFEVITDIL